MPGSDSGTEGCLRFLFRNLKDEMQVFRDVAVRFIDPRSVHALRQLEEDLEGLWCAVEGRTHRWALEPLWTVVSEGEYEAGGRRGKIRVVGCITGTWDVRAIGPASGKPKAQHKRMLEFCGVASTRICLFDERDRGTPIAMWRMELGDAVSPGCYFHVQVLGENEAPPFPKAVSIPRLPSVFVTPMGAVEFVLGELFQDRWAEAAMENTGSVQRWGGLQRRRLVQLLDWKKGVVEDSLTSPWIALKKAKPRPGLFIERI